MYLIYLTVLMIIILIAIIIIGFFVLSFPQSNNLSTSFYLDLKTIREVIISDSYLHRLLMIEIIRDRTTETSSSDSINQSSAENETPLDNRSHRSYSAVDQNKLKYSSYRELESELVTFNKMSSGVELMGKALIRSFGGSVSQRITTIMKTRSEIIRDYYRAMRNVVCNHGTCVHVIEVNPQTDSESKTPVLNSISPIFPHNLGFNTNGSELEALSSLDITITTLRKLDSLTSELTDIITGTLKITNSNNINEKSIFHNQRLFNLITMYDKELINQAKSYASKQYNISMNCSQSSIELSHHIADELSFLMKESQI